MPEHDQPTEGQDFKAGTNEYADLGQEKADKKPAERYLDAFHKSGVEPNYIDFNGGDMGGRWMSTENARLVGATPDEKFDGPDRRDPAVVDSREQAVGKFAVNNGVI